MDASKNENAAALDRKCFDDDFDLTQRVAGVELSFEPGVRLQQFKVSYSFETDDLVTAGVIDDEVAGDGEKIGAACRHRFPVLGSVGSCQDLRDGVFQLLGRRKNAPQAPAERRFVRKQCCFEPFKFCTNPIHTSPLVCFFILALRASPGFSYAPYETRIRGAVHHEDANFPALLGERTKKMLVPDIFPAGFSLLLNGSCRYPARRCQYSRSDTDNRRTR